jgi:hypothetical protein
MSLWMLSLARSIAWVRVASVTTTSPMAAQRQWWSAAGTGEGVVDGAASRWVSAAATATGQVGGRLRKDWIVIPKMIWVVLLARIADSR